MQAQAMPTSEDQPAPPAGMQGREEGQGREGDSPEPQKGGHRSLYDRAFGGGYSDMSMDHTRMPVTHHGDMLDHRDRECEEMLYHRHMAMAAQDRARFASYNAQMSGKTYQRAPADYVMHPMNGSHQQAMMAHAAASRRSMNEMAHAQAEMAHARGLPFEMPFDMPYPAANRRMMYSPYYGADGCSGYSNEQELAHYGMCNTPCGPGPTWKGLPTQSVDIDLDVGEIGPGGGLKGAGRQCDARKQVFSEVKRELVIFPRRKAGQSKRQADNEAPVKLTPEILEEIANIPLVAAANKLGISKTALKNACRNLGLKRWPFRRRREDARRTALMNPSEEGDSPSTAGKNSPGNSNSTDGNDNNSPPHDSMDEDDDLDSSGDEGVLNPDQERREAEGDTSKTQTEWSLVQDGGCGEGGLHGDDKRMELPDDIACIQHSNRSKKRDSKESRFSQKGVKTDVSTSIMDGGSQTPPEQRQGLSRGGSQDEDDLFNVGCNHTASEMWTSLGETENEYHLHVQDESGVPARPWPVSACSLQPRGNASARAEETSNVCNGGEFLVSGGADVKEEAWPGTEVGGVDLMMFRDKSVCS